MPVVHITENVSPSPSRASFTESDDRFSLPISRTSPTSRPVPKSYSNSSTKELPATSSSDNTFSIDSLTDLYISNLRISAATPSTKQSTPSSSFCAVILSETLPPGKNNTGGRSSSTGSRTTKRFSLVATNSRSKLLIGKYHFVSLRFARTGLTYALDALADKFDFALPPALKDSSLEPI
jgi:hypothetical protein